MSAIDNVTAHEFFHLWNIKRIKPCDLVPEDLTHEQYSRALWFSEGVTSAVSRYILLKSGFIDEKQFLARLKESSERMRST
jgi:predicted metalloprotease with PDZ domain